jgi:chorismate mutase
MTSDPVARAEAILKEHRQSIDRLDAILVYTLAERFKHTQAVGGSRPSTRCPPATPRARHARSNGWSGWRRKPTSTPNSPRNS